MNFINKSSKEIKNSRRSLWFDRKKKKVIPKILDLTRGSTSHGIPNIFKTDRLSIRLLWSVCFLAALGACSYMVFLIITDYFAYNTVSNIDYVSEITSEFPAVSFCNLNPLTTFESELFLQEILAELGSNSTNAYKDLAALDQANNIAKLRAFNPEFGDERRKTLGYDLNLVECKFNSVTCTKQDFYWFFDINQGNCFRYSSGLSMPIEKSTKAGSRYGLRLTLFVPKSANRLSTAYSDGLRVFVHNSSIEPTDSDGFYVEPGKASFVAVERTFVSKQPHPYSECKDLSSFSSEFYDYFKANNKTYRQKDCIFFCFQKRVILNCSCYNLYHPRLFDATPCVSRRQVDCVDRQYGLFKSSEIDEECLSQCPLECESIDYDLTISSAAYPTRNYFEFNKDYFNGTRDFEELRSSLYKINIFYPNLGYVELEELPQTSVIDLLSNIGGTMGLYIGISFLSLIEIVEVVLEVIFISFSA